MAGVTEYQCTIGWSAEKNVGSGVWTTYPAGSVVKASEIPKHVDVGVMLALGQLVAKDAAKFKPATAVVGDTVDVTVTEVGANG